MNVSLRDATQDDIDLVYEIQQYPQTRKYARNPAVPTIEEHNVWMRKKLESSKCIFKIVSLDSVDGGFVRLDALTEKKYEISIAIAPSFYGKGVASSAIKMLLDINPEMDVLATVFPGNTASVKLFTSLGFAQQNETEYLYGAKS